MKRRFFECAILLGVVMSVMFLAQTPDGIGHNREDPNTGAPHKPPGHTHNSAAKVDSKGKPVSTGGQDPRGNIIVVMTGSELKMLLLGGSGTIQA